MHVLIPKIVYAGQVLIKAVSIIMMPSQPHTPIIFVTTKMIKPIPSINLTTQSILPIFAYIINFLIVIDKIFPLYFHKRSMLDQHTTLSFYLNRDLNY